jgi:hypothetical protein
VPLPASVLIGHAALDEVDWHRAGLFFLFNLAYSVFLYAYQVSAFRELFADTIEKFTTLPWEQKLTDGPGLQSLGQQVLLDLAVLLVVYLPTFHIFREAMMGSSGDDWLAVGLSSFACSFVHDAVEVLRVWAPADMVCFSLPIHQRLPVRHAVSFVWTAYYSVTRAMCGGN